MIQNEKTFRLHPNLGNLQAPRVRERTNPTMLQLETLAASALILFPLSQSVSLSARKVLRRLCFSLIGSPSPRCYFCRHSAYRHFAATAAAAIRQSVGQSEFRQYKGRASRLASLLAWSLVVTDETVATTTDGLSLAQNASRYRTRVQITSHISSSWLAKLRGLLLSISYSSFRGDILRVCALVESAASASPRHHWQRQQQHDDDDDGAAKT